MRQFIIGIDPGTSTGFAVYDAIRDEIVQVHTLSFWSAYYAVREYATLDFRENLKVVVIEVPDTKRVWQSSKGNIASVQRTAVNVGSVLRESVLLADGIDGIGIGKCVRVNPRGKTNQERFKQLTGWEGRRLNQHERDACMLCYRWRKG